MATVRTILGVVLIGYALYALLNPQPKAVPSPRWALPAGFLGGTLGAAYNIPGPPVVVYGAMRGWPRDPYRATLQTFFLGNGLIVVSGHIMLGHYDRQALLLLLAALPAIALGNLAGIKAERYVDARRFRLLVLLLILATGVSLLF